MQKKLSTKEEYSKRINTVIEYINNHLGEEMSVEKLANISNFSPYHFHRITHALLEEPIGAFITRMRVETAARLLRYSNMPIQQISYTVGYEMPCSLSKAFKTFYGISPNDFRKNKDYSILRSFQVYSDIKLEQRIVDIKPIQVIYIRSKSFYNYEEYNSAWQKLWMYVYELGLTTEKITQLCNNTPKSYILKRMCNQTDINHICIYHDDPQIAEMNKQHADICLSICAKVNPQGEIKVKDIKGGKYAVFTYKGPYNNLSMVYDTIYGKHIFEIKHQLAKHPSFEVYLNDPKCTKSKDLITEIYVPVE